MRKGYNEEKKHPAAFNVLLQCTPLFHLNKRNKKVESNEIKFPIHWVFRFGHLTKILLINRLHELNWKFLRDQPTKVILNLIKVNEVFQGKFNINMLLTVPFTNSECASFEPTSDVFHAIVWIANSPVDFDDLPMTQWQTICSKGLSCHKLSKVGKFPAYIWEARRAVIRRLCGLVSKHFKRSWRRTCIKFFRNEQLNFAWSLDLIWNCKIC